MEIKSYIFAHYIAFLQVYNYRLLTFKTPKCVKLYLILKINNLSVIGIGIGLGKQEVIGYRIGGEKKLSCIPRIGPSLSLQRVDLIFLTPFSAPSFWLSQMPWRQENVRAGAIELGVAIYSRKSFLLHFKF